MRATLTRSSLLISSIMRSVTRYSCVNRSNSSAMTRSSLVIALYLVVTSAQALTLSGRVIRVQDGDSITVLDADNNQHRIRINGIDAPEKGQPFGDRSRQSMANMVAGKDVTADC